MWRVGIRELPDDSGDENDNRSVGFVEWVTALARHSSDGDLDLSMSASLDFALLGLKSGTPEPEPGPEPDPEPEPEREPEPEPEPVLEPELPQEPGQVQELSQEEEEEGLGVGDDARSSEHDPTAGRKSPVELGLVPRLNLGGDAPLAMTSGGEGYNEPVGEPMRPQPLHTIPSMGSTEWVGLDAVRILFDLLHVADLAGVDFQSFVDLLQRAAEDSGTMSLEDEQLDNVVPIQMITEFVSDFMHALDASLASIALCDEPADAGNDAD